MGLEHKSVRITYKNRIYNFLELYSVYYPQTYGGKLFIIDNWLLRIRAQYNKIYILYKGREEWLLDDENIAIYW